MNLSILISLSSLMLCVLFFIYCRSYLKRRTGQERILDEFREEVNGILAEIDEKTDRDALLVEERIKRLKAVIEDTDRRIAVYVRELERRGDQERAYAELGKNRLRFIDPRPGPASETAVPPKQPPPAEKAPTLETGPLFREASQEIPPRPRPIPEQAVELARAGLSPPLIASRLGVTISEAELAVAIAEQKGG